MLINAGQANAATVTFMWDMGFKFMLPVKRVPICDSCTTSTTDCSDALAKVCVLQQGFLSML